VRVRVHEGRPVHLLCDRPGIVGGTIMQASGPWRTSGAWWQAPVAITEGQVPWDRDEWDIALADGTLYRLHVERAVGQWALDGLFD
jgi:protein ImuB